MHYARICNSGRLQRLHNALLDGREHSGMELSRAIGTTCIGTVVSELRHNLKPAGRDIECRYVSDTDSGGKIMNYRLVNA